MCRSLLGRFASDEVLASDPIQSNKNYKIGTMQIVHDNGMCWRRNVPNGTDMF